MESTLLLLYWFIILGTLKTTILIALDFDTYHIAQRIKWFHTDEAGLWGHASVCPWLGPSREKIFGLQTPSYHILQPYHWREVNCSYPEDSSCHKPSPRWHLSMMLSHPIDISVAAGHHALPHNTHHKDPKAPKWTPKAPCWCSGGNFGCMK